VDGYPTAIYKKSHNVMAPVNKKVDWVFQIPPWQDSIRNDWGTTSPAFSAYGGKIQATRFAGGR
jgi:hypothetical protein